MNLTVMGISRGMGDSSLLLGGMDVFWNYTCEVWAENSMRNPTTASFIFKAKDFPVGVICN